MDPSAFWKDYTAHPDEYLFIDVRDPDEYNIAHAKGSINMPIATLADEYKVLPRHGKFIALICGDGRLSMVGYGFLQFEGFTNLIHITGGIQNWIVEGLPVTQGTSTRISTSTVLSSTMTTGTPPGCPKIS
jgi:rhodanese-related sulfurtransferase